MTQKLAALVSKPKPGVTGTPALRRKPAKVAPAPALREPQTDEGESFTEGESEGEMGSVSALTEHRRPQKSAGGFERLPTRELFERGVMAKLVVGDVHDPLEHEADAIADRVMRMPLSGP